jgi:hypothetical protein
MVRIPSLFKIMILIQNIIYLNIGQSKQSLSGHDDEG